MYFHILTVMVIIQEMGNSEMWVRKSAVRPIFLSVLNPFSPSPCTKGNSKWVEDLDIRAEAQKPFKKNVGRTPQRIGIEKNFLNRGQSLWKKANQWDVKRF